jgi:hypothetical protein
MLLYKVLGVILLAIASSVVAYFKGYEHGRQKLDDYILAEMLATSKVVQKQTKTVADGAKRVERATVEIRYVTQEIVKEVPIYVPTTPRDCTVPNGYVVLHDAAATGVSPRPPSESDREDSGYSIAQLAETSTKNLGLLNECRVKFEETKRIYNELKELR